MELRNSCNLKSEMLFFNCYLEENGTGFDYENLPVSINPNPAVCFANITLPHKGHLSIIDIAGKVYVDSYIDSGSYYFEPGVKGVFTVVYEMQNKVQISKLILY